MSAATFVNRGTAELPMSRSGKVVYLLVDAAGVPLEWSLIQASLEAPVAPGKSVTFSDRYAYAGSSNSLLVLFEP